MFEKIYLFSLVELTVIEQKASTTNKSLGMKSQGGWNLGKNLVFQMLLQDATIKIDDNFQ